MKNKTIVFVGILIVLFLAGYAVVSYRDYRHKQNSLAAQNHAAQVVKDQTAAQEHADLANRAKALYEQCKVGLASYNLLVGTVKAKAVMPDCELQQFN